MADRVVYIVESVPAVRNTTPFQRVFFLSRHYDVLVLSLFTKSVKGLDKACAIERNPFFGLRMIGPYLFLLWCLWRVARFGQKGNCMVISSPVFLPLLSGFLIKKVLGIKWVADIYDVPNLFVEVFEREAGLRNLIQYGAVRFFDAVALKILRRADLTICTLLPEALARYRIPKRKLFPLTNGVELRPIRRMMNNAEPPTKAGFVVLYIGYLTKRRGVQTIVEAAARLKNRYPDIEWVLVGPSFEKEIARFRQMVDKFRPGEKLAWVGEVPHEKALEYIFGADVCVFPFPRNFATDFIYPVKIFEYMAMGKAIIATDLCGIEKVLAHEKSALLVEPKNAGQLAAAVERLYLDRKLQTEIGRCAKKKSANFDWQDINNRLLPELRKLAR